MCKRHACSIMNLKPSLSLDSSVDCITNGTHMLLQLLTTAERLVEVSDQSSSDLTSTDMDLLDYCKVCLAKFHPE